MAAKGEPVEEGSKNETRIIVRTRGGGLRSTLLRWGVGGVVLVVVLAFLGSVTNLLHFSNPFGETTTTRSGPVLLKSITELKRFEAASGEFQVVTEVQNSSWLPSFLAGSDTFFLGDGTVNAFVDFSNLDANHVKVSTDRLSASITLPKPVLDPTALDVHKSYIIGQQQGVFDRLFNSDPNKVQSLLVEATKQIDGAAQKSSLVSVAEKDTTQMLQSLLHSLGFTGTITVDYK
ncbi:DUF4230 domain-containing protein [Catenulispora rubra]|uniref:DUF4230 domain-containing protein n=1 Tax=Catenulispora rubra TaxID=280293 RepID=UPI002B2670C1|nr:DUF4230 domain-containing protein [Catenulispora rubra]